MTMQAAIHPDSIAARMDRQLLEYPQEAIHITTDQGVYLAGDTIWMRPFVVDADTDPDIPRGATLTWIPSACPVESIAIPIPLSADINHLGITVEGFDGNGYIVDTAH